MFNGESKELRFQEPTDRLSLIKGYFDDMCRSYFFLKSKTSGWRDNSRFFGRSSEESVIVLSSSM